MRLPHHLTESPFFLFSEEKDFITAVKSVVDATELHRIENLLENGLMPVTSKEVLATMFGVNAGIIWSFANRPLRHYRNFSIPKGQGKRYISAPKVGLKIIQKWIGVQLQNSLTFPNHVFGFIPGRSHISAAKVHAGARWVYSVDIKDFFASTPKDMVSKSLQKIGYDRDSADLISTLCCYRGFLAQGAPSSPVLSNLCMSKVDADLALLAENLGARITRYADDVSFSSVNEFPIMITEEINTIFETTPWKIAEEKTHLSEFPRRLKVHGLLVHGPSVRLTKGYRNRIRAYRHLLDTQKYKQEDLALLRGHINYAEQVERAAID